MARPGTHGRWTVATSCLLVRHTLHDSALFRSDDALKPDHQCVPPPSYPTGPPQLMMAFTADGHIDPALISARDARYGVDFKEIRAGRGWRLTPSESTDASADHWKGGKVLQVRGGGAGRTQCGRSHGHIGPYLRKNIAQKYLPRTAIT